MITKKLYVLLGGAFLFFAPQYSHATSLAGNVFITTDNSDSEGYTGADNITVQSGATGALLITAASGGYIRVNDTFAIQGDFLHNGLPTAGVGDPSFSGTGSFSFTGDNATVAAKKLTVGGDFINGEGSGQWNLDLAVDTIDVTGTFTAAANSNLVINGDYANDPSLKAGSFDIDGGLYMGHSAPAGSVLSIAANGQNDYYRIITPGAFDVDGDIHVDQGRLSVESRDAAAVSGNVNGNVDFNVNSLSVLGDVAGGGKINADTVNIDGNLSGQVDINANQVLIGKDVSGGVVFRPNMPTGQSDPVNGLTLPNKFHVNPDTGLSGSFKQINTTINGTYYFSDDSYLQLVLNTASVNSGDALMKVGGFDASAVGGIPNFENMNSTPNIEILVDNIDHMIRKIRIMEITDPSGVVNLGEMNYAGVWFYWDDNHDGINDRRLFQESKLVAENGNIYAQLAMMQSIEKITRRSPQAGHNQVQMAGAIDDLILGRLRGYAGYTGDDLDTYYTSVMRLLFDQSDVYYDLMLNGGNARDVIDVMVSENPQHAIALVRALDLSEVARAGNKMALSNQISRYAVSDQLMEDFIWKRYYDKNVGWARFGFGSEINSFHVGADTKIDKFIAGFNIGYNSLGFDSTDGSTFNIGLYGTYDWTDIVRAYASLNLGINTMKVESDNGISGTIESQFDTADITLDLGVLHKIFDQYITGRGYLTLGRLGGYDLTQEYKGQDFMDIQGTAKYIIAPGYEIAMGKDIWFSVGSFMRPSIKLGVQYDLLGSANRDLDFKFSQVNNWRTWHAEDNGGLWWRIGGQIDFSFIVGTNLSVRYELLKNGDFHTNQFKINGTYRF